MPEKEINYKKEKQKRRKEGTTCLYLKTQSIRYTRALVAYASWK